MLTSNVSQDRIIPYWDEIRSKQSLRAVLRTLIKIYTFAPNLKFGTK